MNTLFFSISSIILYIISSTIPIQTPTYFDDFNDGDTNGWWFGPSHANPSVYGNWRVENGTLVQDMGGDGFIGLIENFTISDQFVEASLKFNGPAGYGGITVWFQNYNNFVYIRVYPGSGSIWVEEWIEGVRNSTSYPYTINYNDNLWYTLKVKADVISGDLEVYINNVLLFNHQTTTPNRTGQSGLINGNSGGYFDDFNITLLYRPSKNYLPLIIR